jgi:alkaline phosphatase D
MRIDRRQALKLLGMGAAAPAAVSSVRSPVAAAGPAVFQHGVASGDPGSDRVVIWTRRTPAPHAGRAAATVDWVVAEDAALTRIAAQGQATTGAWRDFTVKAEVAGLKPATDYWYAFRSGQETSRVGRTRTLPAGRAQRAVLAVVSCAHYQAGLFNVYRAVSRLDELDAVVHLGDYIYEDARRGHDEAKGLEQGRLFEPAHATVSLADYRARHAQYKTDSDLQAAHARAPWICVWDDHESANNSWLGGAEGHHPSTEGAWSARKAAAVRAYYEWMPVRDPQPGRAAEAIYRSFQFGDLMSLIMLESRLVARAHQLDYETDLGWISGPDGAPVPDLRRFEARLNDPARHMLGPQQEAWLAGELKASVAAGRMWQVVGSQVVMARVVAPDIHRTLGAGVCDAVLSVLPEDKRDRAAKGMALFEHAAPYDLDAWDGYPAARERVYAAMRAAGARPIVVSGDSHAFWANDLVAADGTRVGAEFGTSSVTSDGACDVVPVVPINRLVEAANPDVHFTDHGSKGFVRLELTREAATAELIAVSTIRSRAYGTRTLKRYRLEPQPEGVGPLAEA